MNGIKLIELKWKKWDGLPNTFINEINKHHKLSTKDIKLFWKRFKKDDLYVDILKETRNIKNLF